MSTNTEMTHAEMVKKIQANTTAAATPRRHDRAQHPRAEDHSVFINRVAASVSSPDPAHAAAPHQPMGKRADRGHAQHHIGAASPSERGPHS